MYKLNLTEIELRKKAIDETKDNMVHTKNSVVIDNDTKDEEKSHNNHSGYENKQNEPKKYYTVDAVKTKKVSVKAEKTKAYEWENISGTFIDKLK